MLHDTYLYDAHCHVGEGFHYCLTPEELLRQMDATGVDRAVLVPADCHIAVENRAGNDLVLDAVERWPDRFWGFATVNPWYGERAVFELRRAAEAGLAGLMLDPVLQGFILCDTLVHPVVEAAIERDLPIYVFTGTPVNALPLQLSELALRYPSGHFIMGHMGNTDFWIDVPVAMKQASNIWGEISPNLAVAVSRVIQAGFADRLLFGSGVPITRLDLEVEKIQYWDATDSQRAAIMGGNLISLLDES